ncbi:MAG: hypothetical protein IKU46_09455 [Peptococcaceae bacterium]|nr:hypothetical protein [Peptococcaceae bacterium]
MFVTLCLTLPVYIFCLTVFYFIIKWAVKNGIKEAFRDMKGTKSEEVYIENLQKKFNENKNEVE